MGQGLRWRVVIAALIVLLGVITVVPNFFKMDNHWWFTKKALKYGLDIQGGLHLVMGVDIEGMLDESTNRMAQTLNTAFADDKLPVKSVNRFASANVADKYALQIDLASPDDENKVIAFLDKNYSSLQVIEHDNAKVVVKYLDSYIEQLKERTIGQAIETIRNRIDEFGVTEPSITAQGKDRILIQLPGLEDATRAKELINRTARLTFMMVESKTNPEQIVGWVKEAEDKGKYSLATMKYSDYIKKLNVDIKDKLPAGTSLYFGKNENAANMQTGKVPYLLETGVQLGGESLKDAYVANGEYNQPEVSLNFNPEGAKRFADITGSNIGRRMAIVLDDVVYSAPNIISKIPNGSARITLGGGRDFKNMMDEAKTISMALRAGALPARLEQLEERTVGPSLGADSIQKGVRASIVAGIFVICFMLFFYKIFGLVADLALLINVVLTLAILTLLDATLTLPGIAGIALTLGIAVDANVIIFERIKEELKRGASLQAAVKEGFGKAMNAILDANIVTAATCVVLMYYGTGPVRGFGVTLLIGIITSMFTAIFLTRTMVEAFFIHSKPSKYLL